MAQYIVQWDCLPQAEGSRSVRPCRGLRRCMSRSSILLGCRRNTQNPQQGNGDRAQILEEQRPCWARWGWKEVRCAKFAWLLLELRMWFRLWGCKSYTSGDQAFIPFRRAYRSERGRLGATFLGISGANNVARSPSLHFHPAAWNFCFPLQVVQRAKKACRYKICFSYCIRHGVWEQSTTQRNHLELVFSDKN